MHTAWDTEQCASTWRHRVLLQAQRQLLFLLAGTPAACKTLNLVCCPYPGQAEPSGTGGVPTHPKHHHQYQHPAAGLLGQGRPRPSTFSPESSVLQLRRRTEPHPAPGWPSPQAPPASSSCAIEKMPLAIGLGRCFPYRQIKSVPKGLVSCK